MVYWNILGTADAGPLPEETVVQYHPAAAGVVLRMPDMALPHLLRKIREPHAAGLRNISNLLRLLMTYIIPLFVVGGLILCGLWIVPDILFGMYANDDGKWMSWSHRSIMEWSSFLNFAPYSPFSGTGSLFLPNLPWLNPGALALAIPGPIEYKHLLSYFVYLTELTLSMYLLFLELKLERAYAYTAVLLYIAFFFIPFNSVSGVPSWYSLAPFFAHQAVAMNLATVAWLRAGQSTVLRNIVWGLVFIACLFIAFSSAPTFNLIYVPVYAVFWAILAFSSELDRRALPFRIGLVLCTAAVFSIIGLPGYLSVTAAVSARDSNLPAFLHPGMALLTVDYWRGLISRFSTCSGDQALFLICVSRSPVAWAQIAALLAGAVMIVFDSGRRRALAITVVTMIVLLHFYYLMDIDSVLGPAHIVGYRYLYWTLYPLLFAVVVAGIATIVRRGLPDGTSVVRWIPAVANTGISIVLLMIFIEVIAIRQPRVAGEGVLGFRPIAHIGVRKGPIHRYLAEHTALAPGKEFRGYVGLYLGADDGFVRKLVPIPNGAMAHEIYVVARQILANEFGNMLHFTDLWNSNIPTFEDYGQWITKQMFMFDSDLLAGDEDFVDQRAHTTHIYKFDPKILALLGVRFVVSDGTVTSPLVTEVLRETSTAGTLRLYELENVNLGNFSPTEAVTADSYDDAVSRLRNLQGRDTVILLGPLSLPPSLVPATQARLIVEKGGYHVSAQSRGSSLLVLPVQFSHCWQLVPRAGGKAIVFRANIIQTGIFFQGSLDADLRFGFGLTNSSCRRQDAGDMAEYLSSTQSHRYKHYLTPPE